MGEDLQCWGRLLPLPRLRIIDPERRTEGIERGLQSLSPLLGSVCIEKSDDIRDPPNAIRNASGFRQYVLFKGCTHD